jgi:hypothetical protein
MFVSPGVQRAVASMRASQEARHRALAVGRRIVPVQ